MEDGLALLLTQWHKCAMLNLTPLLVVFRKMGKDGVLMTVSELSLMLRFLSLSKSNYSYFLRITHSVN